MTDRNTIIAGLKERFKNDIVEFFDKSSKRIYIEIKTESLIVITSYLLRDLSARFNIASGLDCRSHIEILYHFTLEDINLIISLRVKLSRENPMIEAIRKVQGDLRSENHDIGLKRRDYYKTLLDPKVYQDKMRALIDV